MATAKKLPSGQWRTLVYSHTDENGKRIYESFTADTKRESEFMAAEFALNKKKNKKKLTLTYGEALSKYIEDRSKVLSPGTIREYKRSRKKDLQDLMNIPLTKITQEMVQKAINKESLTHSPKSVRNMHGLLSAVMRTYRPDFVLNTALPKKVRPQIYVPSDAEVSKLLKCVEDTELELPVLLAAFGPMRRSEICALTDDNIQGNLVHVKNAMVLDENSKWVIKAPKSFAGDRIISFPDFVAEKFKGINGRIVKINPSQITDRFADVLKKNKLEHFRFHDLRHYSASIQHALGIPDVYIMQRGGWGSDGVLKSVYRHAMDDKLKEMNEAANRHFEEVCNTKYNTKK